MQLFKSLLRRLASAKNFRQLFPEPVKRFGRRFLPLEEYARSIRLIEDPNADAEEISTYPAKVNVRLGIITDFMRLHTYYISACRELGVPYKLLDISGPDWLDVIRQSDCNAFLIRPSVYMTVWKQMNDERLKVIVDDMGKIIYPSYDEIWLYESKRRMHYWLQVNGFKHPRTWVFYDRAEALQFVSQTQLPIVYKVDLGSGSSGVRIFRERRKLSRFVNKCFRKGIVRADCDRRDRQWGYVVLQEYLPNVKEWRMIRVGDSYFGYEKVQAGDFHSGSHSFNYGAPSEELLNLAKQVTDRGNFKSMDIDVFVTQDGTLYINELQTVFGLHVSDGLPMVDGKPGRMLFDESSKTWKFEEGNFCRNNMCNLRVQNLLEMLGHKLDLSSNI